MDGDNQAFGAEFKEAKREQLNSNAAENQPQEMTTSQDPTRPKINVFDYQVTSFDNDNDSQEPEMQERGGSLLNQTHKFTPVPGPDAGSRRFNYGNEHGHEQNDSAMMCRSSYDGCLSNCEPE